MRLLLLISALICSIFCFSQDKAKTAKKERLDEFKQLGDWSLGSILLNDGTELKGTLKFDERNCTVIYKDGDDAESFTANSILGFEFQDENLARQRAFYSLEYEDKENGMKRMMFFELLRDFKAFAVMSMVDRAETSMRTTKTGVFSPTGAVNVAGAITSKITEIEQTEIICFLNQTDGKIEPYIKARRLLSDHRIFSYEKDTEKYIDKKLLNKYFVAEEIDKMEKYADVNDLNMRAKEDLIKVLDFCKNLRKEK